MTKTPAKTLASSTANDVSVPIEPTGSAPSTAIGAMITRRSSCV